MIRQRELPCGCEEMIERNGEKHILYTCQQHGGGPLSFGQLAVSDTQASRAGTQAHRRVGIPELTVQVPTITETVTQRVTITAEELKLLCQLVRCERTTLLNERSAYVLARRGDTTRFQELIRQIDNKLHSVTRLGDKLRALLHALN